MDWCHVKWLIFEIVLEIRTTSSFSENILNVLNVCLACDIFYVVINIVLPLSVMNMETADILI